MKKIEQEYDYQDKKINELIDAINTLTTPKPLQAHMCGKYCGQYSGCPQSVIQDEENYKEMESEIRADERKRLLDGLLSQVEGIKQKELWLSKTHFPEGLVNINVAPIYNNALEDVLTIINPKKLQ